MSDDTPTLLGSDLCSNGITESKGERTRRAILQAAIVRFAREGYRATSLTRVANDAGLSPSAIYPYFANKEALFIAAVDEDAAGEIEDGLAGVRNVDLIGDWRHVIVGFLNALDQHPLARRVLAGLEPEIHRPFNRDPRSGPTAQGSGRQSPRPSDERGGTRRPRRSGDGEWIPHDLALTVDVARPNRFAAHRPARRRRGGGLRCGYAANGQEARLNAQSPQRARGGMTPARLKVLTYMMRSSSCRAHASNAADPGGPRRCSTSGLIDANVASGSALSIS